MWILAEVDGIVVAIDHVPVFVDLVGMNPFETGCCTFWIKKHLSDTATPTTWVRWKDKISYTWYFLFFILLKK